MSNLVGAITANASSRTRLWVSATSEVRASGPITANQPERTGSQGRPVT